MDSRRRKKRKAIKMLNKRLSKEKGYMSLSTDKKLMRYLKESGRFNHFIGLVRKKHNIGFQSAVNLIKSNPDIYFLIGYYTSQWTQFGLFCFCYDATTQWYIDNFNKYRPLC